MAQSKEQLLGDIKKGLHIGWMNDKADSINKTVSTITGSDTTAATRRHLERKRLEGAANTEFEACWAEQNVVLSKQCDELYAKLEASLLARHPWLQSELSSSAPSLKQNFIHKTMQNLLFDVLEGKPKTAKKWEHILLRPGIPLTWNEIDAVSLGAQIEGYPLSDTEFYNDRQLPSCLESPFSQSLTRYDLYRLLKKTYPDSFKSKKLANDVFCTSIAPLNHTELKHLTDNEWAHFSTLLVNVGSEQDPKWVLLHKQQETWTVYAPPFLENQCRATPELEKCAVCIVRHANKRVYSDVIDWHAVLLSRVLPWCRLSGASKPDLNDYRVTHPIPLLHQNALEASCLPAQKKTETAFKQAFAKRYPVSMRKESDWYAEIVHPVQPEPLYLLPGTMIPDTPAQVVVAALDEGGIICDPGDHKITIMRANDFVEGMKLAYYQRATALVIQTVPEKMSLKPWFESNLELMSIELPPNDDLSYVYACVARNRFLAHTDYLKSRTNLIEAGRNAWANTGKYMYQFLHQNPNPDKSQLRNIAEMGKDGLDVFFTYLTNASAKTALSCTLDLDCGQTLEIHEYISYLTYKFQSCQKKPLLAELDLIFPHASNDVTQTALINLITTLNDLGEIKVLNIQNPKGISQGFISLLNDLATNSNLCLQIKIPEWDATAVTDTSKGGLKASYRALQNKILGNIRQALDPDLTANTATIVTPGSIRPLQRASLTQADPAEEASSWDAAITYSLVSESVGVQQQAQQEVAQEVQQAAEQQTKPKSPHVREILKYQGKEDELITRNNANQHGASAQDFSLWVGSKTDARFVIQGIDAAAFKQIREFPSLFQFSVDWKNTPGFRVCYASNPENGLILTYDPIAAADDREEQLEPFAIQMSHSKPATAFDGDYRQFKALAFSGEEPEISAWHHLATENVGEAIQNWLSAHACDPSTSESLQHYNVSQHIKAPSDHAAMILMIKKWSASLLVRSVSPTNVADFQSETSFDPEFLNRMFHDWGQSQLKGFGQLFYHYGAKGTEQWLHLVYKVYQKFPEPEHFTVFKSRILDPLTDWSEFLEKEEVDAFTASMQKLAHYPAHQTVLWTLIDTHGDTVSQPHDGTIPPIHFSEVWSAYNRVIDYIDISDLNFNPTQFVKAIQTYRGEFNANQFLRRVYEVLQQTGNRQDSLVVQQHILDHLSEIDWHENGFYYACVHEHYRYWDPALQLQDLRSLNCAKDSTYAVNWDQPDLAIVDVISFTLRFAAQRLQLPKADFDRFKAVLTLVNEHHSSNTALFRLMTSSIKLGVDTVDTLQALPQDFWKQLKNEKYGPLLAQLNQNLLLDSQDQLSRSYHLKMADLPILAEVLTEMSISPLLFLDLGTINALGRALQAYKGDKKSQLKQLIAYGFAHGFNQPLVTAYPWLISDPILHPPKHEECLKFYQQLSSIAFENSVLPNHSTLEKLLSEIHTPKDRQQAVQQLINKNCFIADQDADFRPLNAGEKRLLDDLYLSKTFGMQNRLLLTKLFDRLAIEEGNTKEKINQLLMCFANLDRKNYYDELGQLLGLLVEQSQTNQYYSLEQLTTWINAVFDATAFKTKPYPVAFIQALLKDALQHGGSSLINQDLHQLKPHEDHLEALQLSLGEINRSDLPDMAKQAYAKVLIQFKHETNFIDLSSRFSVILTQLKSSPKVMKEFCTSITTQLSHNAPRLLQNIHVLEQITARCPVQDNELRQLWESHQIKLLNGMSQGTIEADYIKLLVNTDNPAVRIILTADLSEKDLAQRIKIVKTQLLGLEPAELTQLAKYYRTEPRPTLQQLTKLLASNQPSVTALIDHFEQVVQAEGKRHYSLNEKDATELERIINGFKLKTHSISQDEKAGLLNTLYYINAYSQVQNLAQKTSTELLDLIHMHKKTGTDEAKGKVLACMREIVLRKTGKWVNHTQMLDLVYAVLHNDESLLHQIRMGEGKSIITIMRVSYRALNGQSVDVFSSKESLSSRDHQEFSPVLDAFGIRHSHIYAHSDPEHYCTTLDEQGVGPVHYSTMGNFSLFLAGIRWDSKDTQNPIDIHAVNRVAYLDEGDHIMRAENTLFNYSDQSETSGVYNYDAWVYQIAYDFYLQHRESLKAKDFQVSEKTDLQSLYQQLQTAALTIAPDQSNFFQKYLASGDLVLRNQKLLGLLTSAHLAHDLKEGVHFCVMQEQKKLSDTETLDISFAKVMINNQVYHGSTYSDLVQQFLHVRLNKAAVNAGQTPNFFIDPENEVALSLNTRYVLKNYYQQIEACTGTPGNKETLAFYKDEFGIERVIKLPTNLEIKTQFLPPIYCQGESLPEEDEAAHVAAIVASIRDNPDQPILIIAEDDKAVERLGTLIQASLGQMRNLVIDTNAKGLSEAEIVKDAGSQGAVTISSRMGRGTDIRPYDLDLGLRVIRTYPTTPEIVKQEQGRQGRNGAAGVCQDIINYGDVIRECKPFLENARYIELLADETEHLAHKLEKHTHQDKEIWKIIKQNPVMKEQYLLSRTLQRLKHEIQEETKQRSRQKEALIAEGSGQVMEHLSGLSASRDKKKVKAAWKTCKKAIETAWAEDSDGQRSRAILTDFYLQHRIRFQRPPKPKTRPEPVQYERNVGASTQALIAFHQHWLNSMQRHAANFDPALDPKFVAIIYGEHSEQLDSLYKAFSKLNPEQLDTLTALVSSHPLCHVITSQAWVAAMTLLAEDTEIAATFSGRMNEFFARKTGVPKTPAAVLEFSKSFIDAVAGAPDIQFLQELIQDNYPEELHQKLFTMVQDFPRQVVDLCKHSMQSEDVVFLLDRLTQSSAHTRCIDYLVNHHKKLKVDTAMIRSLVEILVQDTMDPTMLENLDYKEETTVLLDFLSQRPGFTQQDYQALQAKICRIAEHHQLPFLTYLASMPPYVSVKTVLTDLKDLPGKHGFDHGGKALQQRIHRMQTAANAFTDFLFDHDIIRSKDSFVTPEDEATYHTWSAIYDQFSVEKRELFFTATRKLNHLELDHLQRLAGEYAGHLSTQALHSKIHAMAQNNHNEDVNQTAITNTREHKFFK